MNYFITLWLINNHNKLLLTSKQELFFTHVIKVRACQARDIHD